MRLILIMILGFIALSIVTTLVGPLIVLGIGAVLTYYAYKNLVKSNPSILGMIWWVIVGITGVSMLLGALPSFMFIAAITALVYFTFKKTSTKAQPTVEVNPNGSTVFREYENFEAQWREITNK